MSYMVTCSTCELSRQTPTHESLLSLTAPSVAGVTPRRASWREIDDEECYAYIHNLRPHARESLTPTSPLSHGSAHTHSLVFVCAETAERVIFGRCCSHFGLVYCCFAFPAVACFYGVYYCTVNSSPRINNRMCAVTCRSDG